MGTAAAPSEVVGSRVPTREPVHEWRSKALARVSTRSAVWLWHGLLVAFLAFFVLLPTLFVLGYVVADWNGVQSIFGDPVLASRIPPAIGYSFGVAGMVALF